MPELSHFDSLLFDEATKKCSFYGVKFSRNQFMADPQKYCDFIDKYTNELKEFIENNNQHFLELQNNLAGDKSIPKYMILGKARLMMENEFQQQLLSKLTPQKTVTSKPSKQDEEEEDEKELELKKQTAEIEAQLILQEKERELKRLRKEQRQAKRKQIIQNINNNIKEYREEKEQRKAERIRKRKEFIRKQKEKFDDIDFEEIKDTSLKALKHAAISVPVVLLAYVSYLGFKNPGRIDDNSNRKATAEVVVNPKKAKDRSLTFNVAHKRKTRVKDNDATAVAMSPVYSDGLPEHKYKNISANIPILTNDQLLQLPNVDLFNYCFKMSNDYFGKQTKYGINKKLYSDFMAHNLSTARMNRISDYNNLSYTDYRIIAKSEIFDTYGIGYMQNSSIASYMYYILLKQYTGKNYVGAVAQGVKDFYANEKKEIHPSQMLSIDRLIDSPYINMRDWKQLITLINKTSVNPDYESKLFSYMKDRVENSGLADASELEYENHRFTYEATLKGVKVGKSDSKNSFLPTIGQHNYNKVSSIYELQKDRDLEVFFNIYMQCSHKNYVDLKYGNNKKYYFSEANRALRNFGINTSLHPSLYCAGMSMASFCQAATIFKEENPDSYINDALCDFINSCNNVHSCISLKNDLSLISSTVHRSYNLEADVKNYMNTNDDAILFVWAPRSSSRYHHQTLFPTAKTNFEDAYTYCAFNNQHWGNESTFAKYMRSRSQYGKSGYFADIKTIIDNFAEKRLDRALNDIKFSLNDKYNDRLPHRSIYLEHTLS